MQMKMVVASVGRYQCGHVEMSEHPHVGHVGVGVGMGIFSKVRESRGRPIHRWNRAQLYFTASSRYTTEVFYCYKLQGQRAFLGQI